MQSFRTVASRTLAYRNKIVVDKKESICLAKVGFPTKTTIHKTVLNVSSTFRLPPCPLTANSYYKCCKPNTAGVLMSEKDEPNNLLKPIIESKELLGVYAVAREAKNQHAGNFMSKPKIKKERTQPSPEHRLRAISATQETPVVLRGHCFLPVSAHGLRYYSVDRKHRPEQSVVDKEALDDVRSSQSGWLQVEKDEFNIEQRREANYSQSQETFPVKSAYSNKECANNAGICEASGLSNLPSCKQPNLQDDSHDVYDDLYFRLIMNGGNQTGGSYSSNLSQEETQTPRDSQSDKYNQLYLNIWNEGNQAGISPSYGLPDQETKTTRDSHTDTNNKPCYLKAAKTDPEDGTVSKGQLTHTDSSGKAVMVDVGDKITTLREARAEARIFLGPEAATLVKENKMKKGDVLTVAQLAGIMAAKQAAQLIPLCHNINLTKADVVCVLNEKEHSVDITSCVRTIGVTGVEMEALTAASVAALTVYDMCKAVTHDMIITDIRLLSKSGGKRHFQR